MNLDTTTKSLQIILGEAKTTTDCDITASYAENTQYSFLLAETDTASNGTTAVTVVAAPAAFDTQRQVKEVRLHNNDTVQHQVTLRLNNNGTFRIMETASVAPGGDFLYTPDAPAVVSTGAPALLLESGATGAKISALPSAATLTGTELVPLVQSGADVQSTAQTVLNIGVMTTKDATGGSNLPAPDITLTAGAGDGTATGGNVNLFSGQGGATGDGGFIFMLAANGGTTSGVGGLIDIESGDGGPNGNGGLWFAQTGKGTGTNASGGTFQFTTGAGIGAGNGGAYNITLGAGGAGGKQGAFAISNIQTTDPVTANAWWASNGRIVVSGANITPVSSTVTSGAAVALTTGTAKDVTTISVPAGNWTITGAVYFTGNAATTVTLVQGSVGTTANTLDTTPGQVDTEYLAGTTITVLAADPALLGLSADVTLGGTTTYRLDAKATFAINTLSAYGTIRAVPRA